MWYRCARKSFLNAVHPLEFFSRSTFILKRRLPIPKFKKHVDPEFMLRKLPEEYSEYLVVETGDDREYPPVELILTDTVEDVGQPGQIVKIEPILAYDLVILGKALYATPDNINKVQLLPEDAIAKFSSLSAYKTMKQLGKKVLSVYMDMHESWTIEPWHIRTNFKLAGVQVLSADCIELPEKPISGPNLALEGKDFAIYLTINNSERIPIRCRLRHFTKIYSNRIVLPPDHDCVPSEPILPEQKELLDSIPLPVYVPDEKLA